MHSRGGVRVLATGDRCGLDEGEEGDPGGGHAQQPSRDWEGEEVGARSAARDDPQEWHASAPQPLRHLWQAWSSGWIRLDEDRWSLAAG